MRPFAFVESDTPEGAITEVAQKPEAVFFGGGTTLIDLMKLDVMAPAELVSVNRLPFSDISVADDGITIGANVRNSDLAHHPSVRQQFPVLSEALLSGASAQLRNMATTAGNLLQRTRCPYFRDVASKCNKREPGSGCDALKGINRSHAILGVSEHCIATHPSDMCVALMMLDTSVHTLRANGDKRVIALSDFYLLPGDMPHRENVLEHGELITHISLPKLGAAWRSHYLKVRDRASYEFALTSAAVALRLDGQRIAGARVALGGVATRPWRSPEAEQALIGKPANEETFRAAAEAALRDARPQKHNAFKVDLAKRTIVLALKAINGL
jgi:xanthine dehydrogenase YagS FAD-binding subunit